jgi:Domain of unknown function (DUF3303)
MKIMQVSRMKKTLTPDEHRAFQAELERFYAAPPEDLIIVSDYVAMDNSCSFTLLEASDLKRLHEINKPFAPYVDYDVFEVRPATQK